MKSSLGNPDFLIIGGGIFGCSIAWNLARRSSGSVLLLERRELATATTPRAAGLIRNLNLKKGQTPLKTLTIEAISLLGDELEETLQWHQVGGLLVAESEANMMHLETLERHAIEHRQKFQWIERTDAEFWMTQIEWLSARQAYLTVDSGASQAMSAFYKKANLKPDLIKIYEDIGNDYRSMVTPIPLEYNRIEHSTSFKIGDRIWRPVFGSGHSPDHVSFYCEKDRIMLGGDMLLPRITPIIAVWWQEPNADPLEGYIEFLTTLGSIGSDALILPAHNRPYKELQTRVADLISQHNERLEITYEACKNENSAEAIMQELFIRKLDPFQTRFAIGETIAHINNLINRGTLKRRLDDDGVYFYSQN